MTITTEFGTANIEEHGSSYRVFPTHWNRDEDIDFGLVRKGSKYEPDEMTSKWYAEIKNHHGETWRYAGIWETRRDAVEEIMMILTRRERW